MAIQYPKLPQMITEKGLNSYKIKKDGGIGQATFYRIMSGQFFNIDTRTIDALCRLLDCQPGDFLEYVPDPVGEVLPQGERRGVQIGGGSPVSTDKK